MKSRRSYQEAVCDFWKSVEVTDGCWNWRACRDDNGYGRFIYGSICNAHRFSYLISRGCIHPDLLVCHTCDNLSCVRPDHLYLGTHEDNARDRENRERRSILRGADNPRAKLSEEQVIFILQNCRSVRSGVRSKNSQSSLANKFGVSRRAIQKIVHGLAWTHLRCLDLT